MQQLVSENILSRILLIQHIHYEDYNNILCIENLELFLNISVSVKPIQI